MKIFIENGTEAWIDKIDGAINRWQETLDKTNTQIEAMETDVNTRLERYKSLPFLRRLFQFKPTIPEYIEVDGNVEWTSWIYSDAFHLGKKVNRLKRIKKILVDGSAHMLELNEDDMRLIGV